jgi:hypothetical protein
MAVAQVLEIIGALGVLAAFAGAQLKRLELSSWRYLGLNAGGSAVLAAIAVHDHSWGFVLLEGVWAVVSVIGLIAKARGGDPVPD